MLHQRIEPATPPTKHLVTWACDSHFAKSPCLDVGNSIYYCQLGCLDNGNGCTLKFTPFCLDWNGPDLKFLLKSVWIGEKPLRVLSGVLVTPD